MIIVHSFNYHLSQVNLLKCENLLHFLLISFEHVIAVYRFTLKTMGAGVLMNVRCCQFLFDGHFSPFSNVLKNQVYNQVYISNPGGFDL